MNSVAVTAGLRSPDAVRGGSRIDTWPAFVLLCLAATTPLLAVGFPPLVDLYGHLARYTIQTDLAARPELQPFYSYQWQVIGNLGADLLVQLLHGVLGLERAVRWIVIATQLLAAAGILLVSRELHGRITPFAIAALPLIYGLPFNYGFLNFSLSMALALLAYAAWLRLRRTGRSLAARVWLAGAGAAIWVCHAYGWAFLCLLCGSSVLAGAIRARKSLLATAQDLLAECWMLLLPLAPMILWRADSGGANLIASDPMYKLQALVSPLRTKWALLDVTSLFALVAAIYWAGREKAIGLDPRLGIAALLCFVAFLVLPKQVFGSMGADVRLMPYVLVTALLAIPPHALGAKALRVLTLAALAFFAGRMATTGLAYAQYEQRVEDALPALDRLPRGARVALLSVAPCAPTWELPVLDHIAGFAVERRSVFANDHWHVPGASPLTIHHAAAGRFAHDPAHLALADGCYRQFYPFLSEVFAQLPYDAFTHVWIVGALPEPLAVPERLERIPGTGTGALYAVKPAR